MPICNVEFEGGGLRNRDIASGASVEASKVIQHYAVSRLLTTVSGTTVTALNVPLHIVSVNASEIIAFEAAIMGAITGDYTVTVDLQKSTGGGAFATVLSSTIEFDTAVSVRTALPAVVSDEVLTEGDILSAVVTVSGSSGAQATGLLVSLTLQDRLV